MKNTVPDEDLRIWLSEFRQGVRVMQGMGVPTRATNAILRHANSSWRGRVWYVSYERTPFRNWVMSCLADNWALRMIPGVGERSVPLILSIMQTMADGWHQEDEAYAVQITDEAAAQEEMG